MEKISEKMQNIHETFRFLRAQWGKIRIIMYIGYNGGFRGRSLPKQEKFPGILLKNSIAQLQNLTKIFPKFVQKQENKQDFLLWLGFGGRSPR